MYCSFDKFQYPTPRLFPYGPGPSPNESGYIDFKAHPELIESKLEDFKPYQNEQSVQTFYKFLRWINGPDSPLESCDCVFRHDSAINKNTDKQVFNTHGRVYVLWRDLAWNSDMRWKWLCDNLMIALLEIDPEMKFDEGAISISAQHAIQIERSKGNWIDGQFAIDDKDPGVALHLQLEFRSCGNSRAEAFKNMDRVFNNLWLAFRKIAAMWKAENAETK
jgi:hypothetical protein